MTGRFKMKTLKSITIIMVMGLFASACSISRQERNQAENMAWIKKNIGQNYIDDDSKALNINVTPCRISWEEIWYINKIPRDTSFYSFNPGDAGQWTFKKDEGNRLIIISESRIIERELTSGKKYYYSEFYLNDMEKDLGKKMTAALNDLSNFCK